LSDNNCEGFINPPYHSKHIVKVAEYYKTPDDSPKKVYKPGMMIVSEHESRQQNNKHVPIKTVEQFEKINKRKGISRGKRVEWFERYYPTPDLMVEKMNEDKLR
jgi:16S rRNA G966 N2-methylase RsmD